MHPIIDEFGNFLERIEFKPKDEYEFEERINEISLWASCRGKTLFRTGIVYLLCNIVVDLLPINLLSYYRF